jgi:hypothetical protein
MELRTQMRTRIRWLGGGRGIYQNEQLKLREDIFAMFQKDSDCCSITIYCRLSVFVSFDIFILTCSLWPANSFLSVFATLQSNYWRYPSCLYAWHNARTDISTLSHHYHHKRHRLRAVSPVRCNSFAFRSPCSLHLLLWRPISLFP